MRSLILMFLLSCSCLAWGQEREDKYALGRLNHFRAAGMMLVDGNQSSYSLMASWNPKFYKSGRSIFGLNLGGSVFEDQEHNKFLLLEYTATWRFILTQRWKTELGLGLQTITGVVGSYPVVAGSLHYTVNKNSFNVDDVFIGYTNFSYKDQVIHEIRVGLGFHF